MAGFLRSGVLLSFGYGGIGSAFSGRCAEHSIWIFLPAQKERRFLI